ncbi:MAG: hypothetical protein AAGF02_06560 [Actinomycetota bacterium]
MAGKISQRELRNNSGQRFVGAEVVPEVFRTAPSVDAARLVADLELVADQGIEPRG